MNKYKKLNYWESETQSRVLRELFAHKDDAWGREAFTTITEAIERGYNLYENQHGTLFIESLDCDGVLWLETIMDYCSDDDPGYCDRVDEAWID